MKAGSAARTGSTARVPQAHGLVAVFTIHRRTTRLVTSLPFCLARAAHRTRRGRARDADPTTDRSVRVRGRPRRALGPQHRAGAPRDRACDAGEPVRPAVRTGRLEGP